MSESLRHHLRRYLSVAAPHSPTAALLLERGEWFDWEPLPPDVEYGTAKECYGNSGILALGAREGFVYYEGYCLTADTGIPIPHAWCVRDGHLIEPTLRHSDNDECGFCLSNGYRPECPTGDATYAPWGVYRDPDPDCEECDGEGCEESPCGACDSTGKAEHPDRTGTVYVGVPVDTALLRKCILEDGTWGVLDKGRYWDAQEVVGR